MNSILALDAGTTGTRAVLFDDGLREKASAYSEFRQFFPRPGWVEQDPEEIFRVARELLRRTARGADLRGVAGLGITNQRETVVAWDSKTLRPLHRAIVWQDRRTSGLCASLKRRGWEPEVRGKTGLVLDPYFSGTKIHWLLEHVPAVRRAARDGRLRLGTVDSWLIARLSGGRSFATDPTNASRTLLFDIDRREWDPNLLRLFRARRELLPEVLPSAGLFGTLDRKVLGLEIPISGVAGDQQAALFGQGCWEEGSAKNTYGTGCFLVANLGRRRRDVGGLLTTLAADRKGGACFALEGSVFIGGAVVQWLRDASARSRMGKSPSASPAPSGRAMASISSPPSSASALRTGTPKPAGRSSGSPEARAAPTSSGRPWNRSPSSRRSFSSCSPEAACPSASCASTGAHAGTTS